MTPNWSHSQILGRELDPAELDASGVYMTIHVGGSLDAHVLLAADLDSQRVSVSANWTDTTGSSREQRAGDLAMSDAETLAAEWADTLAAGHEPTLP